MADAALKILEYDLNNKSILILKLVNFNEMQNF